MSYTVQFENGKKAIFEKPPTDADIDEVAKLINPQNSTTERKPTFAGEVVRGTIKPFARAATNIINAEQVARGKTPTQPFSGKYLGEVKPVGQEGNFGQKLKDSFGVGLDIASTVVTPGIGKGIAKTGIKEIGLAAAKKGAQEGALLGGIQGTGNALEQNKGLGGIVGGALSGAALGGALGGAGGYAASKIASGISKTGIALPELRQKTKFNSALEAVTPKLDTMRNADKLTAIEQGRLKNPTIFSKGKILPDARTEEIAQSVSGLVKKGDKFTPENINNLNREIVKRSRDLDELVKTQTIKPVTPQELDSVFNNLKGESDFLFTTDTASSQAYDDVTRLFKKKYQETGGNLLAARRAFDKEINKKFPTLLEKIGKGEVGDRARAQAVADIREAANELAANSLPEGNQLRQELRHISNMYKARKLIARNAIGPINYTNTEKFLNSPGGKALKALFYIGGGTYAAGKVARAFSGGE